MVVSQERLLASPNAIWRPAISGGLAERTAGGPLRASITSIDQLERLGSYDALRPHHSGDALASTPGLYQLSRDGFPSRDIALNVPVSESDLTTLDLDTFAQLGVPLASVETTAAVTATEQRHEAANLTEFRQQLWRWFLLAAALFLALESALSLRIARRVNAAT